MNFSYIKKILNLTPSMNEFNQRLTYLISTNQIPFILTPILIALTFKVLKLKTSTSIKYSSILFFPISFVLFTISTFLFQDNYLDELFFIPSFLGIISVIVSAFCIITIIATLINRTRKN